MEELLNKLIEKGWKPRGEEEIKSCQIGESFYERRFIRDTVGFYEDDKGTPQWLFTKSLREVCSKESGLWQFVCENKMIPYDEDGYTWYERTKDYIDDFLNSGKMLDLQIDNDYGYRLIESALCDEDKLEEFLLNNIKIDE